MKKTFLALTTVILFAACSSPKYTYYFDRIPAKTAKPLAKAATDSGNAKVNDIVSEKSPAETSGIIADNPSVPIQEETLVASSSKEVIHQPAKKTSLADKNSRTPLLKTTKAERKAMLKAVKNYRAIKKLFPESVKEGDPSKNAFAVVGFASVIAMLLVGLLNVPYIVSSLLFIVALTCCIIGLKSEQRYLAKAGLIIMGIAFLLGLLILLIVLAAFSGAV